MTQFTTVLALYIRNLMGHQYSGRFGALGRGVLGFFFAEGFLDELPCTKTKASSGLGSWVEVWAPPGMQGELEEAGGVCPHLFRRERH